MAEEFDPEWEYFEGDPEVAELLAEAAAPRDDLNPFFDLRIYNPRNPREGSRGFQVYSGRKHPWTHLGRERKDFRRESACRRLNCGWCGGEFTEGRPNSSNSFCCTHCAGQWRGSRRRVRASSGVCACGEAFEPRRVGQRFCSRQCGGRVVAKAAFATGCPACGAELPRFKNGKPKAYCSRRCSHAIANRAYNRKGAAP